jgi:hypothetical protein
LSLNSALYSVFQAWRGKLGLRESGFGGQGAYSGEFVLSGAGDWLGERIRERGTKRKTISETGQRRCLVDVATQGIPSVRRGDELCARLKR